MRKYRVNFENINTKLLNSSVQIIKSSNAQNNGRRGKVVNITMNMIVLRGNSPNRLIKIPKKEISKYSIITDKEVSILPGKRLLGRPEEIKSKSK